MNFFKMIVGRVLMGVVALGVIVGGIGWYETDPQTKHLVYSSLGRILLWLGIVLVWPGASFFIISAAARRDSNAAGAILVGGYTLAELILLLWLFHWHVAGATALVFLILGVLVSALYNLLVCDWIAEKLV